MNFPGTKRSEKKVNLFKYFITIIISFSTLLLVSSFLPNILEPILHIKIPITVLIIYAKNWLIINIIYLMLCMIILLTMMAREKHSNENGFREDMLLFRLYNGIIYILTIGAVLMVLVLAIYVLWYEK
ncbi:hypothetical protein BBF96_13250 [Anoxybacter fermentans]|uniref:Uncharacterized protein n=1 Tax=Anoxybacter fermentans TaxID=1323375 RepID=A0A3Q9HSJ5_9FIRM|nr:hypothetical protein [Anoxybacter fermentans]AZR74282.1 hypothetical protein BBF96_13250 [Anoxybacter fermentans]